MPLLPAPSVGRKRNFIVEDKDKNWLEEYLPIPYGGLRVFLWTLVFLLEGIVFLEFVKLDDFPGAEHPVVWLTVSFAMMGFVLECLAAIWFILCVLVDEGTHFLWIRKYLRNNVFSPRLQFHCSKSGDIKVSIEMELGSITLRENDGVHRGNGDRALQFSVRFGGWFGRRRLIVETVGDHPHATIDFRNQLKRRHFSRSMRVCFSDETVLKFQLFDDMVDYLLTETTHPSVVLWMGRTAINEKKEIEQTLTAAQELASSLFERLSHMKAMIGKSVHHNPRLAEHRAASTLLQTLLDGFIRECHISLLQLRIEPKAMNKTTGEIEDSIAGAIELKTKLEEALAEAEVHNTKQKKELATPEGESTPQSP